MKSQSNLILKICWFFSLILYKDFEPICLYNVSKKARKDILHTVTLRQLLWEISTILCISLLCKFLNNPALYP